MAILMALPKRNVLAHDARHRTRILIAEDHMLVADLCKQLLEFEFDVIGIASDGHELLRKTEDLSPDVILLDIGMPVLNGLDAGKRIKERSPNVKLVFLTMNPDPELALAALQYGASGYLLKTCLGSELVNCIRSVVIGATVISPALKETVAQMRWEGRKAVVSESERLTDRQREVLQLLAEGKVVKEVANILNLTPRTVGFHKYKIMKLIGAKSSAELVRYAVRNHITAA